MIFVSRPKITYDKHLFADTVPATIDSPTKIRHFLCEKRYRIDGVYDNLP